MRRIYRVILLLLFLSFSFCTPKSSIAGSELLSLPVENVLVSRLPDHLVVLGNEALEGTQLEAVYLSGRMSEINSNALAENPRLLMVWLPPSVRYISKNAFLGSDKVQFFGVEGSYAHKWQEDRECPFWPLPVPFVFTGKGKIGQSLLYVSRLACSSAEAAVHPERISYGILGEHEQFGLKSRKNRPELYALDLMFP